MDGRRHSVDLPITKSLMALRRVKSLRDPGTNSMSKLSALVDSLNGEAENKFNGEENNGYRCRSSDQKMHYKQFFGSTMLNQLQLPITIFNEKMEHEENVMDYGLTFGADCEEGGASCDEHDEIVSQLEKELCTKDWDKKLDTLFGASAGDVMSCTGSPCFSGVKPLKRRSMPANSVNIRRNIDVSIMDSCHQGCGLSSCWSRNIKFGDYDAEERRLLLGNSGQLVQYEEGKLSNGSPRNLCQKFMPKSFKELVGQSGIAASLLSAISYQKISSFYLFYGPSGTGKSCVSKIFAATLNCLSDEVNRPCGRCQECTLLFSGRSRDVKQIGPMRMNKVEQCKSFIKDVGIPPIKSRFKVYIFDECHMLSRKTWAAIMTFLDDLPCHVVFVMVAPSLDKLPPAVVSKALKFHFSKVEESEIARMLEKICIVEGIEFDQQALNFIAAKSNGSLRDAEMTLDQLSLLGRRITSPLVYDVFGTVSDEELLDLLRIALSCDAANTVKKARELMSSRIDPLQLIAQLANLIMDILAGKCTDGEVSGGTNLFGSDISEAKVQQLSQALKILSQAEKQLRASKNRNTWLTAALLQLSSVGTPNDVNGPPLSTRSQCQDGNLQRSSSTIERSKHIFPYACEDLEMGTGSKDDMETLEFVWRKATKLCTSTSLKKFLQKNGKLVSIRIAHDAGIVVAELEFDFPEYVAKAEKSWKVIAGALQQMVGYNVELRINLACNASSRNGQSKKPKFCLFNCSRRVHLISQFTSASSRSNAPSVISDPSPAILPTSSSYTETGCTSCCHGKGLLRIIRDNNGNALAIRTTPECEANQDTVATDANGPFPSKNEAKHGNMKEFFKCHCCNTTGFPLLKVFQSRILGKSHRLDDHDMHFDAATTPTLEHCQ